MPKFKNLNYSHMGKMKHRHLGHKTGECISVHVVNMLDSNSEYKHHNGKLKIKSVKYKGNGKYKVVVEDHRKTRHNRLRNPSVI